jgi:hypothetical protein
VQETKVKRELSSEKGNMGFPTVCASVRSW